MILTNLSFLVAKTVGRNSFGCPVTSKDSLDDPEWDRASKMPSKKHYNNDSTHTTCGIWLKASFINHSCDATCVRSFLGDLMIVRAARDLPAGSKLTFSYWKNVGKRPEDPSILNEKLQHHWGFQCTCSICVVHRELSPPIKNRRSRLLKEFHDVPKTNLKKKKEVIQQLEDTYSHPATEVPRAMMWLPLFSLVPMYATCKHKNIEKLVDQVLSTFSNAGYVIRGAKLMNVEDHLGTITVERWGLLDKGATSAWLALRNAYKAVGDAERAEQAKEFGRISWMLLVGEDFSFVSDDPPKV